MYRAVVNLLSNALKYTPRRRNRGFDSCVLQQERTGVLEISFRDTGIGIWEEDREKIFSLTIEERMFHRRKGRVWASPS
jgi:signal transduction histidine kinase